MRSKLLLAAALCMSLLAAGCSLRTNETLNPSTMSLNPAGEGCLSNASDTVDKFFNGSIQNTELDGFWNCTEKALNTFADNTTGANPGYYTPQELSGFLTKYFLNGRVIDAEFVTQAMALKHGLIGGQEDRITRDEVHALLAIFRVMHQETLKLQPLMPITSEHFISKQYTPEQFEAALATFNTSMANIGGSLANVQGSYSFDQLAALLRAMKQFFYESPNAPKAHHASPAQLKAMENGSWIDSALKYTDALRPAKAIFVAPPKDVIQASDWGKIYELAPKYYGIFIKAQFYSASATDYSVEPGLSRLEALSAESISLMRLVLSHRSNGSIAASELDDFYVALDKAGMLPVKLETARGLSRAVFAKIFAGQGVPVTSDQTQGDYSISGANVDRIEDTLLFGTEGLRALYGYYQQRLGPNLNKSSLAKTELGALTADTLGRFTAKQTPTSQEAAASIPLSTTGVRTIFPGHSAAVYVPAGDELAQVSLQHMGKIHLLRTVNRLLLASYSANGQFLTDAEVNNLAGDFFPFLEELGVVTQSTRESLPDRLLEASLFLYSSDGLTSLSMNEALELESLLISTVVHASETHAAIAGFCSPAGAPALDPAGPIPADCYRQQFLAHQADAKAPNYAGGAWVNIPGLSRYMTGLSSDRQAGLFKQMESFLRPDSTVPFTKSDTQSFTLLPYYVEILFSRFDKNRDGFFDNTEAEAAFPVFEPFLKQKCDENGLPTLQDRQDLFAYLLANQEIPDTWWSKFMFWLGQKRGVHPKFRVDRGQVVQIFQVLETAGASSKVSKK